MIIVLFKEPTILTISLYNFAEYKRIGHSYMVFTLVFKLNKIVHNYSNDFVIPLYRERRSKQFLCDIVDK